MAQRAIVQSLPAVMRVVLSQSVNAVTVPRWGVRVVPKVDLFPLSSIPTITRLPSHIPPFEENKIRIEAHIW